MSTWKIDGLYVFFGQAGYFILELVAIIAVKMVSSLDNSNRS